MLFFERGEYAPLCIDNGGKGEKFICGIIVVFPQINTIPYIMSPMKSLRNLLLLSGVLLLLQVKVFAGNGTTRQRNQNVDSIKIQLAMVLDPHSSGEIRYYSFSDWNMYEGDVDLDIDNISSITLAKRREKDAFIEILGKYAVHQEDKQARLEQFGVGKAINTLPDSCFRNLYEGRFSDMLQWNPHQVKYLADSLRKESLRSRLLDSYLLDFQYEGGNKVYYVEMYRNGEVVKRVKLSGRDFYRGDIEKFLQGKLDTKGKVPEITPYLYGKDLLKELAKRFVDRWPNTLFKLGWHDCEGMYGRLEESFTIEDKCQFLDNWNVKYGGKYIDNRTPEYLARLSMKDGNPNVQLMFVHSYNADFNKSIPAMESSCRSVVERVCSVPYIKENAVDAGAQLRIWYFNDRNVNDYLRVLAVEGMRRAKTYYVSWSDIKHSILVEYKSSKGWNMYLLLPDNRLVMLIENGWVYNYGGVVYGAGDSGMAVE